MSDIQLNPRLGVNIDHIATLRQARREVYPSPVDSLSILKECSVDQVTIHLREDRRHIQDQDVRDILSANVLPVNLESAIVPEMVKLAQEFKPQTVTFVPEKREEITTEGGLDCVGHFNAIQFAIDEVKKKDIQVSLFIDADPLQIEAASKLGADAIEIHTGAYCHMIENYLRSNGTRDYKGDAEFCKKVQKQLKVMQDGFQVAQENGLSYLAGHGLNIYNLKEVVDLNIFEEYNIGHAIIARSVFVGLKAAIQEIQACLKTS